MEKIFFIVVPFIFLLTLSTQACSASAACDGTLQNPCFVQDTQNNTQEVRHWRNTQMIAATYQGNTMGLTQLWMSGSAAPSGPNWEWIANTIKKITANKVTKMIDVDLRQETHGYLNNNAVNLTVEHDWINYNKTRQQALADEKNWLTFLSNQTYIDNVLTPIQFKASQFSEGMTIPVITVSSEATTVHQAGLHYFRLTVTDHMAPLDADVDRFVNLIKTLPRDAWLHIHCRGGDGRTTTFMAMYDMLRNANKVSFDEIIKRQAAVSPFYDLSQVERKNPELTEYYKKRYVFLMHFYQFANVYLDGYRGNWSDWATQYK